MKSAIVVLCLVVAASAGEFKIDRFLRPSGAERFDNLIKAVKFAHRNRVVGGVESEPHSHPYQVGLFVTVSGGTAFCGGSLISPKDVLTAAHCALDGSNPAPGFTVVLGAHNIHDVNDGIRIQAVDATVHENYDPFLIINDVAIVHLPIAVELSDTIGIISMPPRSAVGVTFEGATATVSGWGRDSDSTSVISPVLREVDMEIIGNDECNDWYFGNIWPTQICASGEDGKSSCSGDSGGPLTLTLDGKLVEIGVVSFGVSSGCEVGWPSGYSRTTEYLDWIENNSDAIIEA